jgi:hypothetical protein
MKTINAATPLSFFASLDLRDRRAYSAIDTASIKRTERRKSRRQLKAELQGMTYEGIHRDFGMSRLAVMEQVRQTRSGDEFLFAEFMKETNRPLVQRAVTVIRKRVNIRRPLVETLLVSA